MTNVIPWRPRDASLAEAAGDPAREVAALASDLVSLAEQVRAASLRASELQRPALQVERTVQALLDAVTALERGADVLTDEGEWLPF